MKQRIIVFISILFFIFNLTFIIQNTNFATDEDYYVPAARSILKNLEDTNKEHPPTGKLLVASSIKLLGDTPIGWRFFSLISGSIGIILTAYLSSIIFKNSFITLFSSFLIALTPFWNLHSRIASLDVLVSTAILATSIIFWRYLKKSSVKHVIYLGIALGISASIKWVSLFFFLAIISMIVLNDSTKKSRTFTAKQYFLGITAFLASYLLPFIYLYHSKVKDILVSQILMFTIHTRSYDRFLDPMTIRPWSWFTPINNPLMPANLIYWIFPLAFTYLVYSSLKAKERNSGINFLLVSISSLYFPWFIFSRPTYITYSLPLVPFMCISCALMAKRLLGYLRRS